MAGGYTKKQHHIPRFLLQNFADENGFVWVLDKKTENIFPAKPENIACENHLYSVECGEDKDDWLEKQFSEIEGKASPILAEMLKNRDWAEDDGDAAFIMEFLCILMQREPVLCKKEICSEQSLIDFFRKNIHSMTIQEFIALRDTILSLPKGRILRDNFFPASAIFCRLIDDNFIKGYYRGYNNDIIMSDKYCNNVDVANVPEQDKNDFIKALTYYKFMISCPISQRDIIIFINKKRTKAWADAFLARIGKERFDAMTIAQATRFIYGAKEAVLKNSLASFHKYEKDGMRVSL